MYAQTFLSAQVDAGSSPWKGPPQGWSIANIEDRTRTRSQKLKENPAPLGLQMGIHYHHHHCLPLVN